MSKLYSISEASKILNLINSKSKKPSNYILRFWEKEFKQIKSKKINNRRYYNSRQLETLKMIKFLLKDKGMTISGVKKIFNTNIKQLDGYDSDSLKADYYRDYLKIKSKKLLDKINKIKNYGKKNSS